MLYFFFINRIKNSFFCMMNFFLSIKFYKSFLNYLSFFFSYWMGYFLCYMLLFSLNNIFISNLIYIFNNPLNRWFYYCLIWINDFSLNNSNYCASIIFCISFLKEETISVWFIVYTSLFTIETNIFFVIFYTCVGLMEIFDFDLYVVLLFEQLKDIIFYQYFEFGFMLMEIFDFD